MRRAVVRGTGGGRGRFGATATGDVQSPLTRTIDEQRRPGALSSSVAAQPTATTSPD